MGGCTPGPLYDETLGTGEHAFTVTLTGEILFTYGESFYLLGGTGVAAGEALTFGAFNIGDPQNGQAPEGAGPTEVSLTSSLTLTLPDGATLSSASGYLYGAAPVPEPADWMLMLAGLGLTGVVARRVRRL
jgi:hypothetical protein